MPTNLDAASRHANDTRYQPGQRAGHYESFFSARNHPSRPLAFWIRYTIFSPDGRPEDARRRAVGGVLRRQDAARTSAAKRRCRSRRATSRRDELGADVARRASRRRARSRGAAATRRSHDRLGPALRGRRAAPVPAAAPALRRAATAGEEPGRRCRWRASAARSTSTVSRTRRRRLDRQPEPQLGPAHTDHYAWGQVAGFDDAPAELPRGRHRAPARSVRSGRRSLTLLVLRHDGREIALNVAAAGAARARRDSRTSSWRFASENADVALEGRITAPRDTFVGLRYDNPPGGVKHCLNSKIAALRRHPAVDNASQPLDATRDRPSRRVRDPHRRSCARRADGRVRTAAPSRTFRPRPVTVRAARSAAPCRSSCRTAG